MKNIKNIDTSEKRDEFETNIKNYLEEIINNKK